LEVSILLGRPFLERTKAIIDSDRSLYHLLWNNRWLVVDGATGRIDAKASRQLDEDELENWKYTSPPRYSKPLMGAESMSMNTRSFHIQFIAQRDGRIELKVEEEEKCFDLAEALATGAVQRAELSYVNAIPVGAFPDAAPLIPDGAAHPNVHAVERVYPTGDIEAFRQSMLHTSELRRLYLTRIGTSDRIDRMREFSLPEEVGVLRILTWNVNSIRNLLRKGSVFVEENGTNADLALPSFLARHRIDVEVKWSETAGFTPTR